MTADVIVLGLSLASLLVLAAWVGVASGAERARRADRRWLDEMSRRRLLVNTRDGQTLDGLLVRADRDGLVLGPVKMLDTGIDLDGHVFVARERIAWIQQPTDPDRDLD